LVGGVIALFDSTLTYKMGLQKASGGAKRSRSECRRWVLWSILSF
jgi:hypothetical protein